MADAPAESLAADLRAWSEQYQRGGVRVVQLVKPSLEAGEKWAVRNLQVGRASVTRGDLETRRSAMSLSGAMGKAIGGAFATDRRVFIANFKTVKVEWRWPDLHSVRVLDDMQGVVLEGSPDSDQLDVVATDRSRLVSGPAPLKAAAGWLKIEAAFADSRGELEGWLDQLPGRLRRLA